MTKAQAAKYKDLTVRVSATSCSSIHACSSTRQVVSDRTQCMRVVVHARWSLTELTFRLVTDW